MLTYRTRNFRAVANPLRSIPLYRPASILRPFAPLPLDPPQPSDDPADYLELTDQQLRERALRNAEAALKEAVRVYDTARAGIGEANRTSTAPIVCNGHVVMPAQRFSKEPIRERKSYAFRLFNQRRGQIAAARRRIDAARAALNQPSLALVEERRAIAADLRASKRRPIHQIAPAAATA